MRSDYGSLRRRTSDASWQWLLMGSILGLGFALVACVGAYALGAISFPMLEDESPTPQVQIEPNQTEVALQALAAQQTLAAAQDVLTDVPAPDEANATQDNLTTESAPGTQASVSSVTPMATPLPTVNDGAVEENASTAAESQNAPAVLNPTATVQQQAQVQTEPLLQDTPVVGTPPVGEPTQALGLPQGPQVPPELDAVKTNMVPVTGGTFTMGTTLDEGIQAMDECTLYGKTCTDPNLLIADSIPPHDVTVDSFEMEVYEVTVSQYVQFLNWLGPNEHKSGCGGYPCVKTTQEDEIALIQFDGTTYNVRNPDFYATHPVTNVTWWGAVEYCRTLNRRLPTEAEWERAARGPQGFIYPWGFEYDTERAMSSIPADAGTVPVNSYENGTSPYGVYNMAGNVSEWVFDWYKADYYNELASNPEPNPKGPSTGTERVIRGGSWDTIPLFLRSVHRMSARPDEPTPAIGFRCVADIAGGAAPVAAPSTNQTGTTSDTAPNGAPTMAPAPTQAPLPTATVPTGPTATLAPG